MAIFFEDGQHIEILKHTDRQLGIKKSVWIELEVVNQPNSTKVPQKSLYGIHPVYLISDQAHYFDIKGNPITLTQAAALAHGYWQSHAAFYLYGG